MEVLWPAELPGRGPELYRRQTRRLDPCVRARVAAVQSQPGQDAAGKAMVASGALLIVIGVVVGLALTPWGFAGVALGLFDIVIGQVMLRGGLGPRRGPGETGLPPG